MIRFVFVGKTKEKGIELLESKYFSLINRYYKAKIEIVKDGVSETSKIIWMINDETAYFCDEKGLSLNSISFSSLIWWNIDYWKKMVFIIWWANWFDSELISKFQKISLSPLTFNHELARIVLLEQIYRWICIKKGIKYHID